MSIPLLSVCVITYNHAAYIKEALKSVAEQRINFEMEIVVADDCSTDGTTAIIEEFIRSYTGKVVFLKRERNIGPAENFIQLLSAAKGKYIAYLEGDDYWINKLKLQLQIDFLEANSNYSLCFHDVFTLRDGKKRRGANWDAPDTADLNFLLSNGNFIASLSIVFRNNPEIIDFLDRLRDASYGDYLVYIICAKHGLLKFLPQRMGVYRVHGGGSWSKQHIDITYRKIMSTVRMLYAELPVEYSPFLRIQYLKTIEKYYLSYAFEDKSDIDISPLLIPEMNVESSVIDYIRFSTLQKGSDSYYIKSVPVRTLLRSLKGKLRNYRS